MSDAQPIPGAGVQGAEDQVLIEIGPQLLVRLSALIRTARTHDVSNQAFQRQLQEFHALLLRGMEDEHEVTLAAVTDYFYLNGARVRVDTSLLSLYHSLMGEFERRSLGGMRFLEGVSAPQLERFFQLFMAAEDPALAEHFRETVKQASIQHVIPIPASEIGEDDVTRALDDATEPASERGRAKRVFWRAVLGTKKILVRAQQTGRPDLRHAKRLVQPVVDNILRHEYSIVGLTALKDHDEYTYAHCVNVSILSVSMGHVLGFSRQALADLGVAALVHDIGKIVIPGEVLRKPAKLTPEEWQLMRQHPLEGVKMMIRMPGLSMLALDSMRACFEHHMNIDRTGYPEVDLEWGQATKSRIVALADCFDAMTAHRAYHKRPFTAFEALSHLLGPNRVHFDPAVLWALVRTIGLYPPGSVLMTDSNHVVLSVSPNPDDLRRPFCRVLLRPDGTAEPEHHPVSWDPMPPEEHVANVLRPEEHNVKTGEYLAA
jgi:HD-GYP domain-containing protein (c-di-GMP phosphodiesterase class II)